MGNSKIRCFLFGAIIMLLFVSIKTQAQNLENGKKIMMIETNYNGLGIDTMDDLINARKII